MVLILVALLAAGIAGYEAHHDALTLDEGTELTSGVTALVERDLRLNPEHPIGAKLIPAAAALLARPVVPKGEAYRSGDWFAQTEEFVQANQRVGRLRPMLLWARWASIALMLAVALAMFLLGRSLFGEVAGSTAAVAWLTIPYVLGMGHLAMIDVPFTLAVVGVAAAIARDERSRGDGSAAILGIAVGVALASRHLALVLVPVAAAAAVWARRSDRRAAVRAALLVGLLPLVVVWGLYRAVAPHEPEGAPRKRFDGLISAASSSSTTARLVLAVPLPKEHRAGFAYFAGDPSPRPDFLLGRAASSHRWWSLPASALVKLSPVVLLGLLAGPMLWRRAGLDAAVRARARLAVVLPAVVLLLALMVQPLDLGLRVALPSIALGLVAAAPGLTLVRGRALTAVAGAVLALQVVTVLVAAPHSIAWGPPPFRPGYRWASGSNLDLGQDLDRLAAWSRGRRALLAVTTSRGVGRPPGTRALMDVAPRDVTGWVAVSATTLTKFGREELAWLRAYCPVGDLGGTVLLYRFEEPPTSTPGPDAPEPPCDPGQPSTRTGG